MPDLTARHVRIHGRVQGVFFRDTTRQRARADGVAGWIRNCPDGTVEAWLEGRPAVVDDMVDWMHSGPPAARVERVEVDEVEPEGYRGFSIRS